MTVNIPTDFATLQNAIDALSTLAVQQGANITLNTESGHALTAGVSVSDGDYGHFGIVAEDAEVTLDAAFPAADSIVYAVNAKAPDARMPC